MSHLMISLPLSDFDILHYTNSGSLTYAVYDKSFKLNLHLVEHTSLITFFWTAFIYPLEPFTLRSACWWQMAI